MRKIVCWDTDYHHRHKYQWDNEGKYRRRNQPPDYGIISLQPFNHFLLISPVPKPLHCVRAQNAARCLFDVFWYNLIYVNYTLPIYFSNEKVNITLPSHVTRLIYSLTHHHQGQIFRKNWSLQKLWNRSRNIYPWRRRVSLLICTWLWTCRPQGSCM